MASKCIGDCLDIKSDAGCLQPENNLCQPSHVAGGRGGFLTFFQFISHDVHSLPKVTIYTNLHKWPMAEVEFVKSISHGNSQHRTMVMNNITCRQMYLRSYTFTRKENEEEGGRGGSKTGDQLNRGEKKKSAETTKRGRRKKSKATPCRAFVLSLVWKCFSCTSSTKVNKDP
ncbi:hypothetical protein Bca4012_006423 [Brassica carinata]